MKKLIKSKDEALKYFSDLGDSFIIVKNPDYIFSPYEIYPIVESKKYMTKIKAVVMDMDGTTTTTEKICIHSLEMMIRRMSNKLFLDEWAGLTHDDYPHIIGNSTTKHVEYLISKYQNLFESSSIIFWFIYSALWTIKNSKDLRRIAEVKNNLILMNCKGVIESETAKKYLAGEIKLHKASKLLAQSLKALSTTQKNLLVRIGIDIYYQRYHKILAMISNDLTPKIAKELFNDKKGNLIEPMPGVLIFLCLIKGWLEAKDFDVVFESLKQIKQSIDKESFLKLIKLFRKSPAKIGLVTSSIFYEADLVIKEVMKVLQKQIKELSLYKSKKKFLIEKFSDYKNIYNTVVTASDSSEIRLKPHRDLYSIALHQLNIHKKDFDKVVGLEDSESGLIAIRTSGISMAIAVPFAETSGHNLSAASHVCHNGLPELLSNNLFLKF